MQSGPNPKPGAKPARWHAFSIWVQGPNETMTFHAVKITTPSTRNPINTFRIRSPHDGWRGASRPSCGTAPPQSLRSKSGSLAILAAIRRASWAMSKLSHMASLLLRLLRKAFRSPPLKGRHPQAAFIFALRSAHVSRNNSGNLVIFAAIRRAVCLINAFLAALRKRSLLVGIPSSSEQNAEQCFPALCGGLHAGARFGCTQSRHCARRAAWQIA